MGNSCSGICKKSAEKVKAKRGVVAPAKTHEEPASAPAATTPQPLSTEDRLDRFIAHGRQIPRKARTPTERRVTMIPTHQPHRRNAISTTPSVQEIAAVQRRSHGNKSGGFFAGTTFEPQEPSSAPKEPQATTTSQKDHQTTP